MSNTSESETPVEQPRIVRAPLTAREYIFTTIADGNKHHTSDLAEGYARERMKEREAAQKHTHYIPSTTRGYAGAVSKAIAALKDEGKLTQPDWWHVIRTNKSDHERKSPASDGLTK